MTFLLASSFELSAQTSQEFSGVYIRFDESVLGTLLFDKFNSDLKSSFPVLTESVAFPGARNHLLQNVIFYQLGDDERYEDLEVYLDGQPLVEEYLVEGLQIGEMDADLPEITDDHLKYLNSKRVLQDCPTPFDYDDPGTLSTDHVKKHGASVRMDDYPRRPINSNSDG